MNEEKKEFQPTEKTNEQISAEKQKQKTARIKKGESKIIVRTICFCIILLLFTAIATWFISIFMPECVKQAIEIFKNIA